MEKEITVEENGETYKGRYKIEKRMVHVMSAFGYESTQIGGSEPETIAKMILGELVRKYLRQNKN